MIAQPLDLGVLTCDRPLRALYEGAGWSVLPGAVLVGGTRQALPQRPAQLRQDHDVGLLLGNGPRGVDDVPALRIELYPGEIDKLW